MALRFRKRIRIAPGVHINLSKTGVSTTLGPRGASINIGKKGAYLNAGIPGTGIYARERIAGPKKTSQQAMKEQLPQIAPPVEKSKKLIEWAIAAVIVAVILIVSR